MRLKYLPLLFLCLLTACSKRESSSRLSLRFPDATEATSLAKASSEKVGALSMFDFSRSCFIANVTGASVSPRKKKCDPEMGVHTGFVKPGGETTLTVPRGSGYTIRILAFQRATATAECPTIPDGTLGEIDRTKIYEVGQTQFDVGAPEVEVSVTVAAPKQHLFGQLGLPVECRLNSGEPSSGAILISNGKYQLHLPIRSEGHREQVSSGGYKLVVGKEAP